MNASLSKVLHIFERFWLVAFFELIAVYCLMIRNKWMYVDSFVVINITAFGLRMCVFRATLQKIQWETNIHNDHSYICQRSHNITDYIFRYDAVIWIQPAIIFNDLFVCSIVFTHPKHTFIPRNTHIHKYIWYFNQIL